MGSWRNLSNIFGPKDVVERRHVILWQDSETQRAPTAVMATVAYMGDFGVSLLVGFYAMLRTGELLHLKNSHIYMTGLKAPAVLFMGMTKQGKRMGAAEGGCDTLQW